METELENRHPLVKTFHGVFPAIDKYENHRKCMCRPTAEHVFLCKYFFFSEKGIITRPCLLIYSGNGPSTPWNKVKARPK